MANAMRARLLVFGALLLVTGVVVGFLVSWSLWTTTPIGDGGGDAGVGDQTASFDISGDVVEVVMPGEVIPLNLSITNHHDSAIIVTALSVAVTQIDAPNSTATLPCTADDFAVSPAASKLAARVMPGGSRTLEELGVPADHWPTLALAETEMNQDGCKGASLTLHYEGSGRVEQ